MMAKGVGAFTHPQVSSPFVSITGYLLVCITLRGVLSTTMILGSGFSGISVVRLDKN